MTPFRNDEENPFSRESVWPKMPQTPLSVAPGRPSPGRYAPLRDLEGDEASGGAALAEPEAAPSPAPGSLPDIVFEPSIPRRPRPTARPARPPRRRLRLTPLIGAATVGAGGLLTLFLLIGTGPRP